MGFESIDIKKISKEDLLKQLIKTNLILSTKKDKEYVHDLIHSGVANGKYLIARNAIFVGLFTDGEKTFKNIRKKGLFRYSNYVAKKCIIDALVSELLETRELNNIISARDRKYLQSVQSLSSLHTAYKEIQRSNILFIKYFEKKYKGKSFIKTILSFVEYLFLNNHYPKAVKVPQEITSRGKEEICSAISYLIYYYTSSWPKQRNSSGMISEEYILSGEINQLIINACFMADFKDFELLIEHFDYQCIKGPTKLKIVPPSIEIEKTLRIGYIRNQLQGFYDRDVIEDAMSMDEWVDDMIASTGMTFCKYTESNQYPRYVIEIPEPIYEYIIKKFFITESLFKEEVDYLSHIFKEQLLDYNDFLTIKIKDDLTLKEFIKIKRIFTLFNSMFKAQIKKDKLKANIVLRSLIPVFPKELLYQTLEKLTSTSNIDAFLDLVCWHPGIDTIFDLQYRPILLLNNFYYIPMSVLINSNSIRNLYASEYKKNNSKFLTDGTKDALVESLHESFRSAKIASYKQTLLPQSDLDLFAVYGSTLIIFECKQSLEPTSIYDLRTTYDYIQKAEKQLDYISRENSSGRLLKYLEQKHGIKLDGITNSVYCIVLSNRIFSGNAFKYPIRNINEIKNIIEKGIIRTDEGCFSMWKDDVMSLDDLIEYFSKSNKISKLWLDSISVRTLKYEAIKPAIEFDYYYMDADIAIPKLHEFTSNLRKIDQKSDELTIL